MGWKPGELRKPSSRRYNCLLTAVYAKYFRSIGRTLLVTTYHGQNKPDPSGGRNQEEELGVDRTHIEESTQLHHKTSPHMESSRRKEKRKTKEHITPGNGNRHERNEQELDGTRKEGPGQSWLENAGRRPMLHQEQQA
ncbi:hypothetical protein MS3_00005097 [Schistosoma haematobium]|uniref:Uncharacterized protein n=1 Tax=Schistosoma haematobium TaxID=6185 RepID=A0A922IUL1_SCHHA|nr:hypothetical protein MS3_00005097 [Schistosoma haematobium]KAH9587315.1 hypothetical protein MS3_00005097 [Schistosoma haematobium]